MEHKKNLVSYSVLFSGIFVLQERSCCSGENGKQKDPARRDFAGNSAYRQKIKENHNN